VLRLEFRLGLDLVGAAAQDYDARLFELPFRVPKLGRFTGSTRRQRLGKEIEHDALAAQRGKRDLLPVVSGETKLGREIAGLQHGTS
jgi:hypothetical protein